MFPYKMAHLLRRKKLRLAIGLMANVLLVGVDLQMKASFLLLLPKTIYSISFDRSTFQTNSTANTIRKEVHSKCDKYFLVYIYGDALPPQPNLFTKTDSV